MFVLKLPNQLADPFENRLQIVSEDMLHDQHRRQQFGTCGGIVVLDVLQVEKHDIERGKKPPEFGRTAAQIRKRTNLPSRCSMIKQTRNHSGEIVDLPRAAGVDPNGHPIHQNLKRHCRGRAAFMFVQNINIVLLPALSTHAEQQVRKILPQLGIDKTGFFHLESGKIDQIG